MVKVLRSLVSSLAVCTVYIVLAGPALAQVNQEAGQPAAAPATDPAAAPAAAPTDPAAAPAADPAAAPAAAPTNPAPAPAAAPADPAGLRATCEAALKSDAEWRSELRDQLRAEVHEEDYNLMVMNRRHVVYAYAALWIITVLFVVFMWLRQKNLLAEIGRLEHEIRQAEGMSGGKAD